MKKSFSNKLLQWHTTNLRHLPWKETRDPYKIWLSEIILQQTRVEQGLPYYEKIIKKFPTVAHLARANEDEVLKSWEGLGYYTRARNLHAAARQVVNQFGGKFPNTYEDILKLKGVGSYTAAAIASFAFDLPYAVVDGNVFRVLARYTGIRNPIDSTKGKKIFGELAQQLLDKKRPADFNQAMMDFGSAICKPSNPGCVSCIFRKECYAYLHNTVYDFPVKEKRNKIRQRWFNYLVLDEGGKLMIEKRNGKDIWKGLYQFPLIETVSFKNADEMKKIIKEENLFKARTWEIAGISKIIVHKLTHQTILTQFIRIDRGRPTPAAPSSWLRVDRKNLKKYGFPKIISNYVKYLLH